MPVISIVGTKGGTGKSTIAMGFAIWITQLQPKQWVLLIDGDIHVRTIGLKMCPVTDMTLAEVLERKSTLEQAIYLCQLESDEGPLYPHLSILPAGGRFLPSLRGNPVDFINLTKQRFDRMIQKLRKHFSYIIVDTPASMSFEHLILTAIADGIIYVVEPNEDSMISTQQTAEGLKEFMDVNPLGVVINRMPSYTDERKWVKRASEIASVLGVVPEDEAVEKAFSNDLPVVAADPTCSASRAMQKIAQKLLTIPPSPGRRVSQKIDRAIIKTIEESGKHH